MKKKSLLKSASLITTITVISLCISFLKESIFAYWFGTTYAADAYNIATQLPITIFSLISSALGTTVIPKYSSLLYRAGKDSADDYIRKLTTLIIFLTSSFIVFGEFFAPYIIKIFSPGLDYTTLKLSTQIFRVVLPTIIMTEIIEIQVGVLNVHNKFSVTASRAIIQNFILIMFICMMANSYGINAAVLGLVAGTTLQFVFCTFFKSRFSKYAFVLPFGDHEVKDSIKKSIPVFAGIGIAEINKLVDRMVASFMASGTITMLSYASKLSGAISTLIISALTTVLFPEFSGLIANDESEKLNRLYTGSIRIILIIIMPIVFGSLFVSKQIVAIVFFRGNITYDDVISIAPLFSCYTMSILFSAIRQVSARLFYSFGNTKTPMINSTIGFSFNIILNILLSHFWGAIGLAIATTASNMIISILLVRNVRKRYLPVSYMDIGRTFIKVLLACGTMSFILTFFHNLIFNLSFFDLSNMIGNITYSLIFVVLGALIYFICLKLLKSSEVDDLLRVVKSRKKSK